MNREPGIEHLDLLTTKTAGKILDISESTVRWLARTGRLRAVTLPGGQRVFHRQDVDQLREQRRAMAGNLDKP